MRTHPETGRRLLYVNRFFGLRIVGLDRDESQALIDRLCRQAEIIEYQCRFQWAPGSVAFWDNRAVQHYASSDYWPARRVMERATDRRRPPLLLRAARHAGSAAAAKIAKCEVRCPTAIDSRRSSVAGSGRSA